MTSVLVVDDDEDMRTLVRTVLRYAEGLEVVGEAVDGRDALSVYDGFGDSPPDIVVLDNRMPELTGLEVAKVLLERRPDLPIVLFTAFADRRTFEDAEAVGVARVVEKSQVATLADVLRDLCPAA